MQFITATFEDGVLKPTQPLGLPNHTQVRLTVELLSEEPVTKLNQEALAAMEELWKQSKIYSQENLTRDQLHERR